MEDNTLDQNLYTTANERSAKGGVLRKQRRD